MNDWIDRFFYVPTLYAVLAGTMACAFTFYATALWSWRKGWDDASVQWTRDVKDLFERIRDKDALIEDLKAKLDPSRLRP